MMAYVWLSMLQQRATLNEMQLQWDPDSYDLFSLITIVIATSHVIK